MAIADTSMCHPRLMCAAVPPRMDDGAMVAAMSYARFTAETPESVGIDFGKLEALFERAAREVRDGLLPSSQIAVARHGKIVDMRTVGTVTHEGREAPATDQIKEVLQLLIILYSSEQQILEFGLPLQMEQALLLLQLSLA